ncbi:helix-turn-helix domain-containing protein [Bacillus haynesii]|uniref:helix-turn-helix domain-containing protein n=1 Tax=Bacillus haynesii TaxID=1925021 RepID=UPI00228009C3|nr:helix-turn-helix domain-containing protein [Bacillus haynesii]MCY7835248.1 helix-turn-helix domain-containing protein [Bacillus haynesii]MCY8667435.1 helix-turn-helix domain-containing protein [Bacillus haynesii]
MIAETMTVDQTAEFLGVTSKTIYRMVRAKEIPHFRVRKRIFFRMEAIEKWIAAQEDAILHGASM